MAKKPMTKSAPKGQHRMPNGKLMKGAKHTTTKATKKKSGY